MVSLNTNDMTAADAPSPVSNATGLRPMTTDTITIIIIATMTYVISCFMLLSERAFGYVVVIRSNSESSNADMKRPMQNVMYKYTTFMYKMFSQLSVCIAMPNAIIENIDGKYDARFSTVSLNTQSSHFDGVRSTIFFTTLKSIDLATQYSNTENAVDSIIIIKVATISDVLSIPHRRNIQRAKSINTP